MSDVLNSLAQTITNQQQTGGQVTTGNPQNVTTNNPQTSLAQNPGLQGAGSYSADAIRMLDQGSKPLTVSGVSSGISLPGGNTTTATVQQPEANTINRQEAGLYIGLGIAAVLFLAILAYGLLKPRHHKPAK